jgi:hypothetical protein
VSRRFQIAALLFIAAAVATALQFPQVRLATGYETLNIARNLAEHGEFANPFSSRPTGPTAHAAPLYPAFLALLLRIFGDTPWFGIFAIGITILVHALHAALLPSISQIFFEDSRPGIWAAVVTIVLPVFYLFPQYEIMYVATGLMLFCLATHRLIAANKRIAPLVTGVCLGLLCLLNPASILVAILWLAYLLWQRRSGDSARFACLAALALAATLAPWTWRNYRQFHSVFFLRDNLGLELFISNNDCAQGSIALNKANGCHAQLHPNRSDAESLECRRLGEFAYYRQRGAMAVEWIRLHPARFAALTATRIRMFWFPDADDSPWYAASIAFVSIAAFLGLILLSRRRTPVFCFLGSVLLIYPCLYYLVQADPRYRTPILWIPLLAAGHLLATAVQAAGALGNKKKHAGAEPVQTTCYY